MAATFSLPTPTPSRARQFPAARLAAADFWRRASTADSRSPDLRRIAAANAAELDAMKRLDRRLP
jgi:hypothetical protein